jgi:uncharacterized protein YbjT (DUF2867 family)
VGWTLVLNPDSATTAWNKDKTKVLHSHGPPARPGRPPGYAGADWRTVRYLEMASLAGAAPGRRTDAVRSGMPASSYAGIMPTPATDRRVWLITGATSGFGRSLAEEVLRLGDIVVGAGRSISRLDDLKGAYPDRLFPVVLEVTDDARDAEVADETANVLVASTSW